MKLPDRMNSIWRGPKTEVTEPLDVNFTGANHVWDDLWLAGFCKAVSGDRCATILSGGALLKAGDYVVLVDPAMDQDRAEFTKVAGMDRLKKRIWFDRPLHDTFPSGTRVIHVPKTRVARNVVLDGWDMMVPGATCPIWAMFVDGLTIRACHAGGTPESAIRLDFCRNVTIESCEVWDSEPRSEKGRGFDFYNCNDVTIRGCYANRLRHAYHFTNTRGLVATQLKSANSQDASFDMHGRNSSGRLSDSIFDGCVKIGNPTFTGGDSCELFAVDTDAWFQVHGGSDVYMTACSGQNLLLAGYPDAHPSVYAYRSKFIIPDGPHDELLPQVCFNVTGPERVVQAELVECDLESRITGRWTKEVFIEGTDERSKISLDRCKAARVVGPVAIVD